MPFSPALTRVALLAATGVAAVLVVGGGCSLKSAAPAPNPPVSPTPVPSHSPGPSPSPQASPQFFVVLAYASAAPTTDPTYGTIDGYSKLAAAPTASSTPGPSQVITVTGGELIQFFNLDSLSQHTASLLGTANGMNWPPTFTNVNGASAASPSLTPITSSQFSSGALSSRGGTSLVYNTGSPGMYYFGDYFNYLSTPPMRTVFIVN